MDLDVVCRPVLPGRAAGGKAGTVKYYLRVMRPDEKLEYLSTVHWVVYWHAVAFAVLAVAAIAVKAALHLQARQEVACLAAATLFAVLAVVSFLRAWLRRIGTEIVVTNLRVIYKRGLLSRSTVEMNVSKIETVDVEQSLWGRLLDYGNVVIRGSGGTFEPLVGVQAPLKMRNAILVG
jgi:uncharacterized membrane protein YdbT with pleckstrin-like domain